jgi:LytS/YehU family sensor histidine kinase
MSAVGISLSALSVSHATFVVVPGMGGVALDFSHIATFIAALFGGPFIGAIVGLLGGVYAGYYFGYGIGGGLGLLSLVGLPLGKALTGMVAGFLYEKLRIGSDSRRFLLALPMTLFSYIPESIYTVFYFLYLVPFFYKFSMAFMIPLVLPKAWFEIILMSVLIGALVASSSFRELMNRFSYFQKSTVR